MTKSGKKSNGDSRKAAGNGPERIKITIDGKVDIGFTKKGDLAGVSLSLTPGQRIALSSSDPTVDLEIVAAWVNSPGIVPGLSVFLIEQSGANFNLNADSINTAIGMGGGAVSSVATGEFGNSIELNAVQRANPEIRHFDL